MNMLKSRQPPDVALHTRRVAVSRDTAAALALPPETLVAPGPDVRLAAVTDLWIETPLEDCPDWTMAARILGDERGVPVVAEVRVFPTPRDAAPWRSPGEWAAEVLGVRARPIPRGGLSATLLRRAGAHTLRRHAHAAAILSLATYLGARADAVTAPRLQATLRHTVQAAHAAGIVAQPPPWPSVSPAQPRRPGRPMRWTPAALARIALTYDDAIRRGVPPLHAVMTTHRLTHTDARNAIARARATGIMRAAPQQGRAAEPLSADERQRLVARARTPGASRHRRRTR